MRSIIRKRPSAALVISVIALFVAMGATVYAGSKISGKTIKKGSEPGNRLKNNSVTGKQVKESTISRVPDAAALGGIAAAGYTRSDCNSNTGAIKGIAAINPATITTTLSSTGLTFSYNCSGQGVLARRVSSPGEYEVMFPGNTSISAVATERQTGPTGGPNVDSMGISVVSPGDFLIGVYNDPTNTLINDGFTIIAG